MFKKNENGQAIVILAIVLVVLLAFAALAIDAGNAYSKKREAQNAADAAAMAGTRQLVLECGSTAPNETNIRNQALQMIAANSAEATSQIFYITESGARSAYEVGTTGIVPCTCGSRAVGVEAIVNASTPSFLAGLIGQPTLSVQTTARARFGTVETVASGLYPFTRRNIPIEKNQLVTLRILDDADTLPGNFGWLTWDGQNNVPALCDSLTPPGNSQIYYNPGTPPGWTPDFNDHVIAIGKWTQGAPGNKNASCVRNWLDWHIANKTAMIIPLYDDVAGQGSHGNYRVASFAAFELQSYDLTGQTKSMTGKFLNWVTNGEWASSVTCQAEGGVYSVKLVP